MTIILGFYKWKEIEATLRKRGFSGDEIATIAEALAENEILVGCE